MKNKKMVATLASLCLIVVAVVAAVVGVLAAVTQNVNSTFKVSYTARNVDAIVTLKSKGPTYDTRTRSYAIDNNETPDDDSDDFEAWETGSVSTGDFKPLEKQKTLQLDALNYDFGWANENAQNAEFLGVAIYQFKFENRSNHALEVTPAFTQPAGSNLQIKFYSTAKADSNLDSDDIDASWDASTGVINSGYDVKAAVKTRESLTSFEFATSGDPNTLSVAAKSASNGVLYLYMIVFLNSGANDMTSSSKEAQLTPSFTLRDTTEVYVPSV